MQQNLVFGGAVEIAGLAKEQHVGKIDRGGDHTLGGFSKIIRQKHKPAHRQYRQRHRAIGRGQAANAAQIEPAQRQAPGGRFFTPQDPADQKAGNDKEDIHTDKAPRQTGQAEMVKHHRQHGDGAQPVDLGPVGLWGCLGHARS